MNPPKRHAKKSLRAAVEASRTGKNQRQDPSTAASSIAAGFCQKRKARLSPRSSGSFGLWTLGFRRFRSSFGRPRSSVVSVGMAAVLARAAPAARELVAALVVSGRADRGKRHFGLELLLGERLLARELDLAHRVDRDDLDRDFVAFLDHVGRLAHAIGRELRNVHQAVLAGQDLHEGAVRLDAPDLATIDLADLRLLREALDDLDGFESRCLIGGGDRDLARVLDVDLAARRLDDRADRLAARADHVADAVARDLHGEDARGERRNVGARLFDGGSHLAENVEPAGAG